MNYRDLPTKIGGEPLKDLDAVMASIGNILSTPIGSMPGHPEFGCGLDKFLFEQIDLLTEQLIKEEIKYALGRWELRIKLLDISIFEDLDYNRLDIKIKFYVYDEVDNPEREYIYSTSTI